MNSCTCSSSNKSETLNKTKNGRQRLTCYRELPRKVKDSDPYKALMGLLVKLWELKRKNERKTWSEDGEVEFEWNNFVMKNWYFIKKERKKGSC